MRGSAPTLSGGQQQRLRTARALTVRPSVLLLDEPTSSLDPYSRDVIEKLMLRLKSELALVLVTHDLEQALRVSDCVAFMKFGSIEGWGARRRR
jgi:phosphate transport system ATP-binding protein